MQSFERFVDAFHGHRTRDPNWCVMLGVDRHLDELPDPSTARIEAERREARELLGQLDGIDRGRLDFDAALDLDLARLELERLIHSDTYTFNGRTRLVQQPTAGDDVGAGMFLMMVNDPRPAMDRLENICARIEKVPEYVESLLERLDTPISRWVEIDLEKVTGLPALLATIEDWAERESWSDRSRLKAARSRAEQALTSYAERLRALPTSDRLHLDHEADARTLVRLRGITLSLEELHAMARAFLADTGETLQALRSRLVRKYGLDGGAPFEELHAFLSRRFRLQLPGDDLAQVVTRYQTEYKRVLEFVRERDLVPIFDEQDLRILRTPSFMEPTIPAGAMMPAPPFREGMRTSLMYLTLSPDLLDEHTELSIPAMVIHEGMPGHHLQLATAATHPSVIRRHAMPCDQCEGWATMLEDYMLDLGYMGDLTDEARFIGKRDISRIGARVGIDLFFMTGERDYLDVGIDCDLSVDDPFEAASNLLQKATGFVPDRVRAEINWNSQERGYPLSYLTGNHLVWQLKREVIAAKGGQAKPLEVDREFHRLFLTSGNMPLSFLRRLFEHRGLLG